MNLTHTFIELINLSSPSGEEGLVADYITQKMTQLNLQVWRDQSGQKNQSNTGNVYAYLLVNKNYSTLAFSAHMDTVQKKEDHITPVINGQTITSDGKTILGADNKAGVAVLIEVARLVKTQNLKHNLLFFFPTREEAGIMGSSFFCFKQSPLKYIFNVDNSDVPGVFIYQSLGYLNFEINLHGLSAHAAKSYEKGIDAIKASSYLIQKLPLGKNLKSGWSLNIGVINGGTSTNVVCDQVILKGEMRAFKPSTLGKLQNSIKEICQSVSQKTHTTINFDIDQESYIPPFNGSLHSEILNLCTKACSSSHLKYVPQSSFSTSDANFFHSLGIPVVSLSRGGENAHSVNEKIKISHMTDSVKLILSLINLADS